MNDPDSGAAAPLTVADRWDSLQRWVAAILITGVFCALLISQSLAMGALALPSVYDDVSYYVSGAELLKLFHDGGLPAVVHSYVNNPPHSPWSTGLAFLGFALFGIKPWVGPVMDGLGLLFFLRAFLWCARALPVLQGALLSVALLGIPFFGLTLLQFRPDMFCSLLVASGTLYIVLRPRWRDSIRDQLIAGVLFALALWAKPSVFHLTTALFLAAMLLANHDAIRNGRWGTAVRASLVTFAVAVIGALPYFALTMGRVLGYIWTTVFGSEAAIWVQPLPFTQSVLFYLTGEYGKLALGSWLYAGLAIAALACGALWSMGNAALLRRAALAALLVLAAYLAVTIPTFKGPHGYPFAAMFVVGTALAAIELVRVLPKLAGWGVVVLLLLYSGWQFSWPAHFSFDRDYANSRSTMVRQSMEALGTGLTGATFLQTTPALHLNYSVLALEYYAQGRTPPVAVDLGRIADLAEHRRKLETADVVFALTPEITEVLPHLPTASPEFRAKEIKLIEESGLFEPALRIKDPVSGGAALFYLKPKTAFTEFSKAEGLYPISGPFPQWNLPLVRWGGGHKSTLVAQGPPGKSARLMIEARSVGVAGQSLTVEVNGKAQPTVPITDDTVALTVPLVFDSRGNAEINLKYGVPLQNAVLYKRLIVRE